MWLSWYGGDDIVSGEDHRIGGRVSQWLGGRHEAGYSGGSTNPSRYHENRSGGARCTNDQRQDRRLESSRSGFVPSGTPKRIQLDRSRLFGFSVEWVFVEKTVHRVHQVTLSSGVKMIRSGDEQALLGFGNLFYQLHELAL